MTDTLTKIIVKVGSTSKLSFSHSKVYRAIDIDELIRLSEILDDCKLVIIENIEEDEVEKTKEFISQFTCKDTENHVWFYVEDNDETTCGVADELDLDIFLTKEELFRNIYDTIGLNISTSIAFRKELFNKESSTESAFDEAFDMTFGELSNDKEVETESKVETSSEVEAEQTENNTNTVENEANSDNKIKDTVVEETQTEIDKQDSKLDKSDSKLDYNDIETDSDSLTLSEEPVDVGIDDKVIELTSKLKDALEEKEHLADILAVANSRISELSDLNKALNDQYSLAIDEYNKMLNDDITMEDPITLQEYKGNQDKLTETLKELDKLKDTVESLNKQIEENENSIDELNRQLAEKSDQLNESTSSLDVLKEQIKNGEIQSEELEKSKEKVEELEQSIKTLESSLELQKRKEDRLNEIIESTQDSIEKESIGRQTSVEFNNVTILKIAELREQLIKLKEENESQSEIIDSLKSSDSGNNETIAKQSAEIVRLRGKLADVDKQINDAVANKEYENNELTKQLAELQEQLDIQTEQLKAKEEQYNNLILVSGVDENGANALVETNKTLDQMNKALRNQVRTTQDELERIRKEKYQSDQVAKQLTDKNKQLSSSLKAFSANLTGVIDGSSSRKTALPAIDYQGKAFIIPVIGCGSFGTTTTAMSIARRLSMASKVAYVDLDLVAPKADGWFNQNPICKNVKGCKIDNSCTAMGLFFDKGMQFFINNIDDIRFTVDQSKGGLLDYYSGVYKKVSADKFISAQFSTLLTYLGNNYHYIIIDLGRLGSSELNDQMIKIISDVSTATVAVTTSDTIEVRNFRIKLTENQIKVDKVAWLLNMCETTKVTDRVRQLVSPARFGIMTFNPDMYGQKQTFYEYGRFTKDKLELFINSVVFGQ